MAAAPETCPTCSTAIPAGALRCPGCGRVFGEDNRCPQCSAIAGVRRKGSGYVCAACGSPREIKPGTVVLGAGRPARAGTALAGRARGLRFAGVLSIGAGVAAAIGAALVIGGSAGVAAGAVLAAALVGGGFYLLRSASRGDEDAQSALRKSRARSVVELAAEHGGDLVASQVAARLAIPLDEADALLTTIADGERVRVEVDRDGVVHYVFPQIRSSVAPRVRVEAEAKPDEQDEIAEEARARVERELRERGRF